MRSKRLLRELAAVAIVVTFAYIGGYYYGRNPKSARELLGSKSTVVMTSIPNLIASDLQAWLEDHWGHSMLVETITTDQIESRLSEADFIVIPSRDYPFIKASVVNEKFENLDLSMLEPDLVRKERNVVPLLWKLIETTDSRKTLSTIVLGRIKPSKRTDGLVQWMLQDEFQILWAKRLDLYPANEQAQRKLQTPELRKIPLRDLIWE